MANGHNNIKRIVHRSCEEIGATFRIARATSWPEAINTFRAKLDIQVMSRNGYKEPPAVKERLLRKHETVLQYLENSFGDFFESYDYDAPLPPSDPALEGKIWMCWWQGEENAPEIVRACIDSVRRNASGHEVVVITDENLSDYAIFPIGFSKRSVPASCRGRIYPTYCASLCLPSTVACGWMPLSSALARYMNTWICQFGPLKGLTICMLRSHAACLRGIRLPAKRVSVIRSSLRETSSSSIGAIAIG